MRLVIREYLASLSERRELDAILPDLLTEMGLTVFSRPTVGTRQHGVDIGAVGVDEDGIRKVFLFSVKAGNLTRQDWNVGQQALKPSLDEIRHVYLRSRLPIAYANLPVAICLTFGGGIHESVRSDVEGYIDINKGERVSYQTWDGDHLARLIDEGPLGEGLMSGEVRAHLRKSAAMVEEPDIATTHFARLIRSLTKHPSEALADRLRSVRQITLCLWILFGWGRDAHNVEAPYRASEMALLHAWELLKNDVGKRGSGSEAAGLLINALVEQQHAIWDALYAKQVLPHVDSQHAISMAVASQSALDINLKLFEMVGRIALRGLWLIWAANPFALAPHPVADGKQAEAIDTLALQLIALIRNNPALLSPITDHQAIDIGLAITFLATRTRFHSAIGQWAEKLSDNAYFAFRVHRAYPTVHASYWYLASHPAHATAEYRQEATEGSVLYPMLALWAEALGQTAIVDRLARFKSEELGHCNFQLFYIDESSEAQIYIANDRHGSVLCDVPARVGEKGTMWFVQRECEANPHYSSLSAVAFGHWPILLTACRHHRLPLPPQIWMHLLSKPAASKVCPAGERDEAEEAEYARPPLPRSYVIAVLRTTVSRNALARSEKRSSK